jgi:hypothetical protein
MCRKSPGRSDQAGFTLIEATISMTLLLIILLMSMGFLISMRTFSQRQEMSTQPRQTARRALDYLTYYMRGATDMNFMNNSPNAIVSYYRLGTAASDDVPAAFNNITGSEAGSGWSNGTTGIGPTSTATGATITRVGDEGTDVITVGLPSTSGAALFNWPSTGAWPWTTNAAVVGFTEGCGGSDALNLQMFKSATGAHTEGSTEVSNVLTAVDADNNTAFYKITTYTSSACGGTLACTGATGCLGIQVVANPATVINPAGGLPAAWNLPARLYFVSYATFRVKRGQLQQKTGLLNVRAAEAAEDALFAPLLDNVEDLQVAYIYEDGSIFNYTNPTTGVVQLPSPGIPTQNGVGGAANPVTEVAGLRVSVTARSSPIGAYSKVTKGLLRRPASEDHAEGSPDRFYHYRLTATVLIRNRSLGS